MRTADAVLLLGRHPLTQRRRLFRRSYVYAATEEPAALLDGFTMVVTKSTVPVDAGDKMETIFARMRSDEDLAAAMAPAFPRAARWVEGADAVVTSLRGAVSRARPSAPNHGRSAQRLPTRRLPDERS